MAFYVDVLDRANELSEAERSYAEAETRRKAELIPVGNAGECGRCGEWSGRLVNGVCAPCRDEFRLP
jgi:hypothetical protein